MNFDSIPTKTAPTLDRNAALTLCAAATLFLFCGGAFAQIDPGEKLSISDKTQRTAPIGKVTHNPPGDLCGHNPPGDQVGRTGNNRVLLPAVKEGAHGKAADAPQTQITACQKH